MLTIIIVTWNSRQEVSRCLGSLQALGTLPVHLETIVVDNASEDGTREFLETSESKFEPIGLRVIYNSRNVGLSRATEQAINKARGESILLCNPDIVFNNTVRFLISYGFSHPEQIATAEMVNTNGTLQRVIHRRFPTVTRVFFDTGLVGSFIDRRLMKHIVRNNYVYKNEKFPPVIRIDQPGASFLLLGRKVVGKIGFIFDSAFPIWWNDVDLAKRAEKAGVSRVLLSDVKIEHALGYTQIKVNRARLRHMFFRGMITYARKWNMHPFSLRFLFSADAILGVWLSAMVQSRTHGPIESLRQSVSIAAAQAAAVLGG